MNMVPLPAFVMVSESVYYTNTSSVVNALISQSCLVKYNRQMIAHSVVFPCIRIA